MIRNSNALYNLAAVLDRINPRQQDVVVLHLRVLSRAGSGGNELSQEDLFSTNQQELFTRALSLAEKRGKSIHLAVAPATEKVGRHPARRAKSSVIHNRAGDFILESNRR